MDWLERYAEELGVASLTADEAEALLDLARDVAHGTERRFAPLSTFLAGVAAGAADRDRPSSIADALAAAQRCLSRSAVEDAPDPSGR